MTLIRIFAWLVRGKTPPPSRIRARLPRAITVPAPRDPAVAEAFAAAGPAGFRGSVPLRPVSDEPPTPRR